MFLVHLSMKTEQIVSDVIRQLEVNKLEVSKGEWYYNGFGYRKRYHIKGINKVDGKTPYLGMPVKIPAAGFIANRNIITNFFLHNGNGFNTSIGLNEFIRLLKHEFSPKK